jgi:hypothetical protein
METILYLAQLLLLVEVGQTEMVEAMVQMADRVAEVLRVTAALETRQ